jgi:hypothetical protein
VTLQTIDTALRVNAMHHRAGLGAMTLRTLAGGLDPIGTGLSHFDGRTSWIDQQGGDDGGRA